jgi:hypothetical protein
MDMKTSTKISRGMTYEAYSTANISVGYFNDGSGVLLESSDGDEIAIYLEDIATVRMLLRYCQAHCNGIIDEDVNDEM